MRNKLTLTFRPWRILNKIAILLALPVLFAFAGTTYAQDKVQITGTVVEGITGDALPGVSILIKGTSIGTITDISGNFSIEARPTDVLVFSYIGYLTDEIQVGANTVINVTLAQDIIGLDEVVVTGYGVQKKSDLTGAIASVSGDKLTEMPLIGVDQALQGRAAGVNVTQATGMPGGDVNIQIRGISSINGTEPLIIVDGVRGNLEGLNPNDIESIEVLKDASSQAIYGASGGNGVVLVTTKKGKKDQITTSFNSYMGWSKPWKKIDVMDKDQYIEAMNIIYGLRGDPEPYCTRPDTMENYDWQDIMFRTAVMQNYDFSIAGGSERSTYFFSTAYTKEEGVLRKSDYERLNVRFNSEHELGTLWPIGTFVVGENVSFNKRKYNGFEEWEFQNEYNTPIVNILRNVPHVAPYDENGEWVRAPFSLPNAKVREDITNKSRNNYSVGGNVYVAVKDLFTVKGLELNTRVNGWTDLNITDRFDMEYEYNATIRNDVDDLYKKMEHVYGWEFQEYMNYNRTIANMINLELMAGAEIRYSKMADMDATRIRLFSEAEEMLYFDGSIDDTTASQIANGSGWEEAAYAYFGRLNLDFANKILLTANARLDYDSRFGPNNRRGFFPSFSVGYKFSEEEFIKNLGFINFGKIRFGYGETGAPPPDRYAYAAFLKSLPVYAFPVSDDNSPESGAFLAKIPNPDMRWETVVMSNIGLDLGFLQNKLSVTIDGFWKTNQDMLINNSIPLVAGMYQYRMHLGNFDNDDARPTTNIGSIVNKGIEVSVGYRKMEGKLRGDFDLNFTYVQNEVLDLAGDSLYRGQSGVNLQNITLTAEGYPVSQINGFRTDGLFTWDDAAYDEDGDVYIWNQPYTINTSGDTIYAQSSAQPGDFRFVDVNNDGVISDADKVNIGNPNPKFIFGFSTNLTYGIFDLNIFLDGKFGHELFNGSRIWLMGPNVGNVGVNMSPDVLDQYREDVLDEEGNVLYPGNTDTDLPRLDPVNANRNLARVSDFYVEPGWYVRLKNIQLGVSVPSKAMTKVGIDKLRFYVGARNLLTFTKYSGFDPEVGPGKTDDGRSDMLQLGIDRAGNYPHARSFIVGLNLQF